MSMVGHEAPGGALQVLRIGPVCIGTMPNEPFAEIGLEFRKRSPVQPAFLVELAHGSFGYMPTARHFELGGYETWLGSKALQAARLGEDARHAAGNGGRGSRGEVIVHGTFVCGGLSQGMHLMSYAGDYAVGHSRAAERRGRSEGRVFSPRAAARRAESAT